MGAKNSSSAPTLPRRRSRSRRSLVSRPHESQLGWCSVEQTPHHRNNVFKGCRLPTNSGDQTNHCTTIVVACTVVRVGLGPATAAAPAARAKLLCPFEPLQRHRKALCSRSVGQSLCCPLSALSSLGLHQSEAAAFSTLTWSKIAVMYVVNGHSLCPACAGGGTVMVYCCCCFWPSKYILVSRRLGRGPAAPAAARHRSSLQQLFCTLIVDSSTDGPDSCRTYSLLVD